MFPYWASRRFGHRMAVLLVSVTLASILAACGSPPVATVPTAGAATSIAIPAASSTPAVAPTAGATLAPTNKPTSVPTAGAEPTSQAEPAGILPTALIYNKGGQLYRLEVDGTTITKLTDEQPFQPDAMAISEFDVSPADGSLVYVTQQGTASGRSTTTLVGADADGTNRTVLLDGSYVTAPRFSPDGTQILFGVVDDSTGSGDSLAGGVYVLPATGGTPQLVQANDAFDAANPTPSARAYAPSGWSPDGRKLLLRAFLPSSEFCETVIKELGSETLIKPIPPEGMVTGCGTAPWSADSRIVYLTLYCHEPLKLSR